MSETVVSAYYSFTPVQDAQHRKMHSCLCIVPKRDGEGCVGEGVGEVPSRIGRGRPVTAVGALATHPRAVSAGIGSQTGLNLCKVKSVGEGSTYVRELSKQSTDQNQSTNELTRSSRRESISSFVVLPACK